MKLIVGLGNPGSTYEKTRHNAGFMAVDRLHRRHAPAETPRARFDALCVEVSIRSIRCLLLKPITYMNLSGRSVAQALGFFKLDPVQDLLVLVDDVALPTGAIRLRATGGSGGHNGLSDIQRAIGTPDYPRLRIGIDACPPVMKLEDYVLGRFSPEQLALLEPALDKVADAAEAFATEGLTPAMNRFNTKDAPASPAFTPTPTPTPTPAQPRPAHQTLPPTAAKSDER